MRIHIIGNSHVRIFTGNDNHVTFYNGQPDIHVVGDIEYYVYHIGPTIAFNFYEHHFPYVKQIVHRHVNKAVDKVMLVVGEVDCRWHLPKQAATQNRSNSNVVQECCTRFCRCYTDLQNEGYTCIGWGGHPSTNTGHDEIEYQPVYGSVETRNDISREFANTIKTFCDNHNIAFVSILESLIDESNKTKMEYFRDYCHLKSALVLPTITELIKRL